MDNEAAIRTMQKMRVLFLGFVVLVPVGLILAMATPLKVLGVSVFAFGTISGVVCAFITCPCCSQLSGVFFKGFIGGVFPMGSCVHCRNSYLAAKGCGHDS